MKKTQRWLCMLLVFCMLLSVLPFTAAAEEPPASSEDESMITISTTNYKMKIEKTGFRYSFEKPDGTPIIAAHETSGLRFGAAGSEPSDVVSTEYSGEVNGVHTFRVKNANNMEADVTVMPSGNHVEIEVVPDASTASSEGGERYLQLDASEGATTIWEMKDWDNTVTDYAVEARLRLPSGGQMGIMAHSKGLVEDGHLFFLTGGKVGLKDLVNLNGTSISLAASTKKSVSTGTWYTVKLAVQDKTLTGYLNGEQVLSATQTDEHKPDREAPDYDFTKRFSGAPALRAVKDYSLDVQSIKVTSLDGNTIYCNYDFSTNADANTFTGHFNSLRGSGKCELIDTRTNEKPTAFVIDARVGGVEHMYGLGDHGVVTGSNAMKNSVNVVGTSALNKNDFANNGAVARFISNFSIAPDKGFAQVLFEDGYKRVAIDSTQSLLGVGETQKLDGLYYFFGTPQEIYADYKAVRTEEGYADAKPDYSMFGVGWEAYGAFGGGSSQNAVTECIQNYLNKGYHLTWGVIGSGFWPGESSASEEFAGRSGTTTSFGMWDTKGRYPNPDELKQFFKDNHMKLLLGLRNHLRLPASYEGQSFENAVWSKELDGEFVNSALENGYFLKDADGKVIAAYPYYPGYNYNGNKGCFDHISHQWLIDNIPMDKSILKQFLKAGFVFQGELFPTEEGTPQGGIISPILANMALDGMQKLLSDWFHTNRLGKVDYRFRNAHKVNLVRYADDFIVTAATKEIAEEAKALIRDFLKTRGLELSEEKTLITHIDDGFDMLGWTFRKFDGKLIVKPSKKSLKAFKASLSETVLGRGKAWKQDLLIEKLNQQIRGWTNYHQSVCASEAFAHIDYVLYELLWRWAKRRHPHKGKWWVSTNYWHRRGNRNWVFSTEDKALLRVDHIPIIRHTKVRMDANPYLNPEYFHARQFNHGMKRLSGRFKQIWKNQNGYCYHCGLPMDIRDEREIFFKVPKSKGGKEEVRNMAYVHKYCNQFHFERRAKA